MLKLHRIYDVTLTLLILCFLSYLGHYIYIEATYRHPNDTARIISQSLQLGTTGKCLKFWYHMYGSDIYLLNMYAKQGKCYFHNKVYNICDF